jgi:hypothetical protein
MELCHHSMHLLYRYLGGCDLQGDWRIVYRTVHKIPGVALVVRTLLTPMARGTYRYAARGFPWRKVTARYRSSMLHLARSHCYHFGHVMLLSRQVSGSLFARIIRRIGLWLVLFTTPSGAAAAGVAPVRAYHTPRP